MFEKLLQYAGSQHLMNTVLTPLDYFGQRERILPDLLRIASNHQGPYENLFDPFSGSGSISFAAMQQHLAKSYHINDSTPVLSSLWGLVKDKPSMVICAYEQRLNHYMSLAEEGRRIYYQNCLDEFNQAVSKEQKKEAALLFPFLINHADANMPLFNASFQLASRPDISITKEQGQKRIGEFTRKVYTVSRLLKENNHHASSGDFTDCIRSATRGDLVVFDPPYPAQSESIYYNPKSEQVLWEGLRASFALLNQKGVDFMLMYGANAVTLSRQFQEPALQLQHLIRLSYHPIYKYYLEHVYVSEKLHMTEEKLPHGMVRYETLFAPGEEMSETKCNAVLAALKAKFKIDDEEKTQLASALNSCAKL
jgi:site-specific DNA-adenine methylase